MKEINHAVLTLGLEDCLQVIAGQATLRLGATGAVMMIREDDGLRVAAWKGVGATLPALATDVRSSLGSWIVQTGTSLVIDDVRHDPLPTPSRLFLADCRSLMAAPLVLQNRVVGAFILESVEPRSFRGDGRSLFELFTQQANLALLRAHLATDSNRRQWELRKANRLRDVLEQANRVMLDAESEAALFTGLCRTIRETGGLRGAWVGRLDLDGRTVRVVTPVDQGSDHADRRLVYLDPESSCLAARAARLGRMQVEHEYDLSQCGVMHLRKGEQSDIGSVACLPLEFGEGSRGVLAIYASDPRYFTERECSTLQALARAVPLACRSVRERESARREQTELMSLHAALEQVVEVEEIAVWEWNVSSGHLVWRGAHAEVFGLRRGVTEGVVDISRVLINHEDHSPLREVREQARRAAATYECEYFMPGPENGVRWFRERGRFIPDSAGVAQSLLGSLREVTREKDLEHQLRCQTQHARDQDRCLNLIEVAVATTDGCRRITFWNNAAERLFGLGTGQVLGRNLVEILLGGPMLPADAENALRERGEWTWEMAAPVRNGVDRRLLSRWTVIPGAAAEPASLLVQMQDVTECRRLEAQRRHSQRLESVGVIARGIAHDLNNALTPLLMAGELIRSGVPTDQAGPFLEVIEQNGQRAAEIVRQLQSLARGAEGERIPIQMRHLVRGVLRILKDTHSEQLRFEARLPADVWPINGDPVQLQQALLNLCGYASHPMLSGRTVVVQIANRWLDQSSSTAPEGTRSGAFLVLTVGPADRATSQVQESGPVPGRASNADESGGSPAGPKPDLECAMATVREHGGFIRVMEKQDQTILEAWLPALAETGMSANAAARGVRTVGSGCAVLVAEDDATVCAMTRAALEAHGYMVHTAVDGADALGVFVRHRAAIKVVVIDALLPVMDSEMLVRTIRRLDSDKRIVVCATDTVGAAARQRLDQLRSLGVAAVISKPFVIQHLLAALEADAVLEPGPGSLSP